MNVETYRTNLRCFCRYVIFLIMLINIGLVCTNSIFLLSTHFSKKCDYNTTIWIVAWSAMNIINLIFIIHLYRSSVRLLYVCAFVMISLIVVCLITEHIWIISSYSDISNRCKSEFRQLLLANFILGWLIVLIYLLYIFISFSLETHSNINNSAIDNEGFLSIEIQTYPSTMISDSSCSICIVDYSNDDEILKLECDHSFHNNCIREWLSLNDTCPMCRNIVT